MDTCLCVRWTPWWSGLSDGEQVYVWPVKGRPFLADPHMLPQPGRFVIYERNSINGRLERVFDVVYPDGYFMPLDRRALEGLGLRRMWARMGAKQLAENARETKVKEAAKRKSDTVSALQNDEAYTRSLELLYRENIGHAGSFALGAPGAPAAERLGKKVAGYEYEPTAKPKKLQKPPDIRVSYE